MAQLKETYACVPSTERGRGILISGDPKSNSILYCNGRSVIIMNLDRPLEVSVYAEHAYQATVARFSPNSEWVASADVSGSVRIWGTRNEHVLKKEFRVLSGRIDDLQWSPDGLRIVASGEGKGKSFVRAFINSLSCRFGFESWSPDLAPGGVCCVFIEWLQHADMKDGMELAAPPIWRINFIINSGDVYPSSFGHQQTIFLPKLSSFTALDQFQQLLDNRVPGKGLPDLLSDVDGNSTVCSNNSIHGHQCYLI
ncbi:hypothetical protein RJ640_000719 [Escallonia rubra]|uniref:Uncharacterized protein n=1 Tax=Escallonia rubra TaxID=112253 RepID=A0AA88RE65_9ASTE|nr:hypothetical protein RJ640_000719 [Escallonia rubra]